MTRWSVYKSSTQRTVAKPPIPDRLSVNMTVRVPFDKVGEILLGSCETPCIEYSGAETRIISIKSVEEL